LKVEIEKSRNLMDGGKETVIGELETLAVAMSGEDRESKFYIPSNPKMGIKQIEQFSA
jgi:hypothetical protein